MAKQFYDNQVLFITGASSDIGKVLLEKILYSLSNINHAYLLIPQNNAFSAYERFYEQILESEAFFRIRQKHQNFKAYIESKFVILEGDTIQTNLGLNDEIYQRICQNTTVFINITGNTKSTESLDMAIRNTCLASMNLLQLAKNCPNIRCFVHLSTANQMSKGLIAEEVQTTLPYPEQVFEQLMSFSSESQAKLFQEKNQGIWPDNDTFFQSLTENLLKVRAGNLPVIICRLPHIGVSWKEPCPGWIEANNPIAIIVQNLLKDANAAQNEMEGDIVPCDICCNIILACPYFYSQKPGITVLNIAQFSKDKIIFDQLIALAMDYFKNNRASQQFKQENHAQQRFTLKKIQNATLSKVGKMLRFNSNKQQSVIRKQKQDQVQERHFISRNVELMVKNLKDDEVFQCNILDIPMIEYGFLIGYGISRWVLMNNVDIPIDFSGHNLNTKFNDKQIQKYHQAYLGSQYIPIVLDNQDLIDSLFEASKTNEELARMQNRKADDQIALEDYKDQQKMIISMVQDIIDNQSIIKQKTQQILLDQIQFEKYSKFVIDINNLRKINKLKYIGPALIVTPYRSKLDFIVLKQVFYKLGIQQPFTVALNLQKNIELHIVKGGTVNNAQSEEGKDLKLAIIEDLLKSLIEQNQLVHIFIEDTENTLGNINFSSNRLLDCCTQLLINKIIKDITFIPISIVYDKILDLYNEQKPATELAMNLGNVHVHVGKKFKLKKFIQNSDFYQGSINYNLQQKITSSILRVQAITPIQIISSWILLMNDRIRLQQIQSLVQWTTEFLKQKNCNIGELEGCNFESVVQNNIKLFSDIIARTSDEWIQLNSDNPKSIIMLQYYTEQIQHTMREESLICLIISHQSLTLDGLEGWYFQLTRIFDILHQTNLPKNEINLFTGALNRLKEQSIIRQKGQFLVFDDAFRFLGLYLSRFAQSYIDIMYQIVSYFQIIDLSQYQKRHVIFVMFRLIQKHLPDIFPYITKERVRFLIEFLLIGQIIQEYRQDDKVYLKAINSQEFWNFDNLLVQFATPSVIRKLEQIRSNPRSKL